MRFLLFFHALVALAALQQADEWRQWMERGQIQLFDRDYTAAASSCQLALRFAAKVAPRGPQVGSALNCLANAHTQMGRLAEAEREYRAALAAAASGSKETPDYALLLANLGAVELDRGHYAKARTLLEEAIAIDLKILPRDAVQLALARHMLARALMHGRAYTEAEQLIVEAVSVLETNPAARPEWLAGIFDSLGALRRLQGREEAAASEFAKALAASENAAGPGHPILLRPLNNLAVEFTRLGRMAEAAAAFERAVSIVERNLKVDPPTSAVIFFNYASFLRRSGDRAHASDFEKRGAAIRVSLPVDVSMLESHGPRRH